MIGPIQVLLFGSIVKVGRGSEYSHLLICLMAFKKMMLLL